MGIFWVGSYSGRKLFRVGIVWGGIDQGKSCAGGNCPKWDKSSGKCQGGSVVQWEFSGWELIGWEIFGWESSDYRTGHRVKKKYTFKSVHAILVN